VNTQKMYSSTGSGQASKTSSAMTIVQIDQALRDFVLQDTAHLRRDAETSQREPEAPQMVSEFVRQVAGTPLTKLDETITGLTQLRDFLHADGERIKQEIAGYLQFVAKCSVKWVIDDIKQCTAAAAALPSRPRRGCTDSEGLMPQSGHGRLAVGVMDDVATRYLVDAHRNNAGVITQEVKG
jgi:hypothetical protein